MENTQQSSRDFFKIIACIHLAMVLGLVLFGIVVYFFVADFQHPDLESDLAGILVYFIPGLVIAGIVASNVTYRLKLNALREITNLKTKLAGYRESLIIRYALLEAPAMFALIAIFITNNANFLVYAGLLIVLMVIKRPTRKSAMIDLELGQQEISVLEDPDSMIE